MSENILFALWLMLGLGIGGFAVWLVLRPRVKHEYDRARSESEAERATLAERLQGKHDQTRRLESDLTDLNSKLAAFQNENASLLARISSLETQLERESRAISEQSVSRHGCEGIAAFLGGRSPVFV